jgi:hypothetical protein
VLIIHGFLYLYVETAGMTGINYVTNDKGENTAIQIDLAQLRNTEPSGIDLNEFLEELDDIIAVELSKGQPGRPYNEVRNEILNG